MKNSFSIVPSTRLNYFQIFLYFSVVRPNLPEYLCSEQVCSAIPRLRAWNSPSRRRYLASTCFPTTIYDVMKRIRSASESFLPLAARPRSLASHRALPPPPLFHPSYLSDSLAITPGILLPPPFIPPFFFSYRLSGLLPDETNWCELRDSTGFHLQFSKFRVFRARFVGVLQFPPRLRPYEPFGSYL